MYSEMVWVCGCRRGSFSREIIFKLKCVVLEVKDIVIFLFCTELVDFSIFLAKVFVWVDLSRTHPLRTISVIVCHRTNVRSLQQVFDRSGGGTVDNVSLWKYLIFPLSIYDRPN